MALIADPTLVGQGADAINNKAMMAYYTAKLQGDSDTLAFSKAKQAFAQAESISTNFGFAPGGNWNTLGPGGPTQPPPGTPTSATMGQLGYQAFIPGYTGTGAGQTMGQLSGMAGTAQSAAGLTGFYNAPKQSEYTPGTFVRLDPSTYDTSQYGDTQISYVTGTGQLQRVTLPQAKAMGWNGDLSTINVIPTWKALMLEAAPPSSLPQETLEGLTNYSNLNTAAQNRALGTAGVTGYYTAPSEIRAPGTNAGGGRFSDLDQQTQQSYYYSNGGDWQAAMNKWVADSDNAARQAVEAAGGVWNPPNQPGQSQETMAKNEQDYTQWLRATEEARNQWTAQQTAAQNYLTLLSNLRGPADYAKYQQVLGATPGGMKDLVAAAAGQYVPGGGATTGVQPQAVNLQNFVGGATGQGAAGASEQAAMNSLVAPNQMAPQTWNALTPSQQQMLLGTWEGQGYTKDDAQALFNQSLPKYATNAPAAGAFRLQ